MQPLDGMTFDNVITKLRMLHDSFRKDTITKLG